MWIKSQVICSRTAIWVILICLVFIQSAAVEAQYDRNSGIRFGLNPAQSREVFSKVDRQQVWIDMLSQQNGISSKTLRAIALELGFRNPDLKPDQYIRLIQVRAQEAGELKTQIANLHEQVRLLQNVQLRAPAAAALERAQKAFANGDLLGAEAELATLKSLRTSELLEAQAAWLEAVQAEARAAHLRGDASKRNRLLREARDFSQKRQIHARREAWILAIQEAGYLREDGDLKGDNKALAQAIDLYREIAIPLTSKKLLPLDWAQTQSDLGVALYKLGIRESSSLRLEESLQTHREELEERQRSKVPLQWAATQHNIGNVLRALGGRETSTQKLEAAVASYRLALEERTRRRAPQDWAKTQGVLAEALRGLGERKTAPAVLEEAVAAYRATLSEISRQLSPIDWAGFHVGLGNALREIGVRTNDIDKLEESIAVHEIALQEFTRERVPLNWAATKLDLGNTLFTLGELEKNPIRLRQAAAAFRAALQENTRERVPLGWATNQNSLGSALMSLGQSESDTESLKEAVTAFSQALEELTRERHPFGWAVTTVNLASIMGTIADKDNDREILVSSIALLQSVNSTVEDLDHQPLSAWKRETSSQINSIAKKHGWESEEH